MNPLGDKASLHPRTSLTKAASAGQGGAVVAAAVLAVLNRRYGWGWDEEIIAAVAAAVYGLLQTAATWGARRASERIEKRLVQGPRG